MRVAFFSDVHANLPALEAVLDDIATVGVDARYAPRRPRGLRAVAQRGRSSGSRAEGFPIVMGNYDDGTGVRAATSAAAPTRSRVETGARATLGFAWTKAHISDANKAWLRTLHPQIRFEADGQRFLLVHGSPRRINEYLYEDKPDATFARIAAGADADVIVCGHTHRPYDKTVAGTRFINVGSAGKPKDGDPRACWALVGHRDRLGSSSAASRTTSSAPRAPSRRRSCPSSSRPSSGRRAATSEPATAIDVAGLDYASAVSQAAIVHGVGILPVETTLPSMTRPGRVHDALGRDLGVVGDVVDLGLDAGHGRRPRARPPRRAVQLLQPGPRTSMTFMDMTSLGWMAGRRRPCGGARRRVSAARASRRSHAGSDPPVATTLPSTTRPGVRMKKPRETISAGSVT